MFRSVERPTLLRERRTVLQPLRSTPFVVRGSRCPTTRRPLRLLTRGLPWPSMPFVDLAWVSCGALARAQHRVRVSRARWRESLHTAGAVSNVIALLRASALHWNIDTARVALIGVLL